LFDDDDMWNLGVVLKICNIRFDSVKRHCWRIFQGRRKLAQKSIWSVAARR